VAAREAQLVVFVVDASKREEANAALQQMMAAADTPSSSADGVVTTTFDKKYDDDDDDEAAYDDDGNKAFPPMLLVLNKCDLEDSVTSPASAFFAPSPPPAVPSTVASKESPSLRFLQEVPVSCRTGDGVDALLSAVEAAVRNIATGDAASSSRVGGASSQPEPALLTRARHRRHARGCLGALDGFLGGCASGLPVEVCAEELRIANRELGRVVGAIDVEEVLDVLFRDFCIGK